MSEYAEYVNEQILKAKLEPKQEQTIVKAEQENPVLTMFEKFDKGLEFDKPTEQEQLAMNKASSESEVSEPRETVDNLFTRAKKGEI